LKQVDQARLAFSDVLLMTPDCSRSIYGLMTASYLTGDARTACAMADQILKLSQRPPCEFLRSSIPVYASCGSFARADWVRAALVQHQGYGPDVTRVDQRLAQWKAFYNARKHSLNAQQTSMTPNLNNGSPWVLAQAFTDSNSGD